MIYDGVAVRRKLVALREALSSVKQRTELDPFDEAMFDAIHAMLEVNEVHSAAIQGMMRSARKLERKMR